MDPSPSNDESVEPTGGRATSHASTAAAILGNCRVLDSRRSGGNLHFTLSSRDRAELEAEINSLYNWGAITRDESPFISESGGLFRAECHGSYEAVRRAIRARLERINARPLDIDSLDDETGIGDLADYAPAVTAAEVQAVLELFEPERPAEIIAPLSRSEKAGQARRRRRPIATAC